MMWNKIIFGLGICALSLSQLTGAEPQSLDLKPGADGKFKFEENLISNQFKNTIEHLSPAVNVNIQPHKAVIMKNRWSGRQKINFSVPVKQIRVAVRCFADARNWACSVRAGLSVDGKNIRWSASEREKKGQIISLEMTAPEGLKSCYFHIFLQNNSGIYPPKGGQAYFQGYVLTADTALAENAVSSVPQKQLELTLAANGTVRYVEKLHDGKFEATVNHQDKAQNIAIHPGRVQLMKSSWSGQQKIVFNAPVKTINVDLKCFADAVNWGCSVEAGLSADGRTVRFVPTERQKKGQILHLTLNDSKGLKTCYLHIKLRNKSGIYPKNGAPASFSGYVIKASK